MSRPDADLLIAGGGLAAQRCCETLRRLGFDGRIVVLCEEPSRPYDRPPLSKSVLVGEEGPAEPSLRPAAWYEDQDVELMLGVAASGLDPGTRAVALSDRPGEATAPTRRARLRFDRLLIATGSRPRRLPGIPAHDLIHELRTYEDALALRTALRARSGRLAILGAGLVGMEVAAAARALGREVTLIEAADTPLARALPPVLGTWIAYLHRLHGVDVRLGTMVQSVSPRAGSVELGLSDGSVLEAEDVLVAVGTVPATEWLAESGLGPGAIEADAGGRTALPGVYAAGDVACFHDPYLGRALPSQHWEAAVRQGGAVARSIAGLPPLPPSPSMFWSDQHGRRIQFVGHAPAGGEIVFEGDPIAEDSFAAWISRDGRTQGALLVDRPRMLPQARARIAREVVDPEAHPENFREEDQHEKRGAPWHALQ